MKIIIFICILCLLCGCSFIYDLTNFTVPNDEEFLAVINSLDTPKKICKYMEVNFTYESNLFAYTPYQMWVLNRAGDCNDYATWAIFVAHLHGYEVYQIVVYASYGKHMLGVFVEDGYSYSDNQFYKDIHAETFQEIVNHHAKVWGVKVYNYKVYDYDMNFIEMGN